jgi:hypothetical protein
LNGTATIGGDLNVDSGLSKLYLKGTVTVGGDVSVRNNCTLGGSGTIDLTRLFDIYSGGTIVPGDNGVGTLSITGGGELNPNDNSIYEWEMGPDATDTIDISGADSTLILDNFKLKILHAGGNVARFTDRLTVFTYEAGVTTVNMGGFNNDANNFDTSALTIGTGIGEYEIGTLALTDDGAGAIYLTGLRGGMRPPNSGTVLMLR